MAPLAAILREELQQTRADATRAPTDASVRTHSRDGLTCEDERAGQLATGREALQETHERKQDWGHDTNLCVRR